MTTESDAQNRCQKGFVRPFKDDFRLSIQSKPSFDLLEPVMIELEMMNESTKPIFTFLDKEDYKSFIIHVYKEDGAFANPTAYRQSVFEEAIGGSSYSWLFDVAKPNRIKLHANLMYDMSLPGDYSVMVEFKDGYRSKVFKTDFIKLNVGKNVY